VREFQQRLEKTGLSPEAVHRIVERFEPAREVFLSETHAIEGRGKEGAAQAMMAARDRLAVRLQAELGPVDYDWALYANERSNRVVVNGVPPDADSNGGLTAGDIFFSYAGQRIFTRDDLRRARAQSVDEALIPARLVRGTVWIDAKLPAEPLESLGFRFDDRREQPPELPAASQDNLVAHGS
jgi:hypothetical protein